MSNQSEGEEEWMPVMDEDEEEEKAKAAAAAAKKNKKRASLPPPPPTPVKEVEMVDEEEEEEEKEEEVKKTPRKTKKAKSKAAVVSVSEAKAPQTFDELVKRQAAYEAAMNERLAQLERDTKTARDQVSKDASRITRAMGIPFTTRQRAGQLDTQRFSTGYAPPRTILEAKFYDVDAEGVKVWRAPGMDFQDGQKPKTKKNAPARDLSKMTLEELIEVKASTRFGEHVNASFSEVHDNEKTPCVPYWMLAEQVQKNTRLLHFLAQHVADPAVMRLLLEKHADDLVLASVPHLRAGAGVPQGADKTAFAATLAPREKEMELEAARTAAYAAQFKVPSSPVKKKVMVPLQVESQPPPKELLTLYATGRYYELPPPNDFGFEGQWYEYADAAGNKHCITEDEANDMVSKAIAYIPATSDFGGLTVNSVFELY